MGLFDAIVTGGSSRKEMNFAREQQSREMAFGREQNVFTTAGGADTDRFELAHQETKSNLIRWQQELEDELMNLVFQLKGYKKDENLNWFKPKHITPLCNDKFVEDVVIPQATPFISRNLINSNFTEERILLDLRCTMNDIADNMCDSYDVYGIDPKNYSIITRLIKNVIKSGAFRAMNGWTKKEDSRIQKHISTQIEGDGLSKKQRSLFGL
jgi:hypothetical protein